MLAPLPLLIIHAQPIGREWKVFSKLPLPSLPYPFFRALLRFSLFRFALIFLEDLELCVVTGSHARWQESRHLILNDRGATDGLFVVYGDLRHFDGVFSSLSK